MKMENTFLNGIIAGTQTKWIRPSLLTLAILATVLVATGCTPHH